MAALTDQEGGNTIEERLPYHAPELKVHGTVEELTLGSGGGFASIYDSPTPYCGTSPTVS